MYPEGKDVGAELAGPMNMKGLDVLVPHLLQERTEDVVEELVLVLPHQPVRCFHVGFSKRYRRGNLWSLNDDGSLVKFLAVLGEHGFKHLLILHSLKPDL
jgi:hypothetical protein